MSDDIREGIARADAADEELIYWLKLDANTFPILPESVRERMRIAAIRIETILARLTVETQARERAEAALRTMAGEKLRADNRAVQAERRLKEAESALGVIATWSGNVIFNGEQRPNDHETHMRAWRDVNRRARTITEETDAAKGGGNG